MALVNVIPACPAMRSRCPARPDPARVEVRNGSGDRMLAAAVTRSPGFEGTPSVAMADVNGDNVLDLLWAPAGIALGSWRTAAPTAGRARSGPNWPASARLRCRVQGAESAWPQPISTANAHADNIIVGAGPGTDSRVTVFSSTLPTLGATPEVFSTFTPYRDRDPVSPWPPAPSTSAPDGSSIVTAPGPGEPARIRTFGTTSTPPPRRRARGGTTDPGGTRR